MSTGLRRIGRYELSKRLSSGKTSELWMAFDPQSHSYVTIKVFYTSVQADSDSMLQFRQSVERVASLQHPLLCASMTCWSSPKSTQIAPRPRWSAW